MECFGKQSKLAGSKTDEHGGWVYAGYYYFGLKIRNTVMKSILCLQFIISFCRRSPRNNMNIVLMSSCPFKAITNLKNNTYLSI